MGVGHPRSQIKKLFSNEHYIVDSLFLLSEDKGKTTMREELKARERERISHWKEKRSINSQSLDLNFNGDLWDSKEKHCMDVCAKEVVLSSNSSH